MNKFFLILIFSLSGFIFAQEGIDFQDNLKFSELQAKAKKENKLIFIDAYASWCGPCKLMAKNIFPLKEVSEYFNANFVNARFDMEKGEGVELRQKYMVNSFPTYLFLNSSGDVVSKGLGYMEQGDFIDLAKDANNPNNKKGSIKERFEAGENDPQFLLNIIKTNANSDYDFAKKASERYFQVRTSAEFTKEDLSALLFFLKSASDPNYKYFVQNKAEIIKLLPENVYGQFDTQLQLSKVFENSLNKENGSVNEPLFLEEATKLTDQVAAQRALYQFEINYFAVQNNFQGLEKAAISYYRDGEDFDANELLRIANLFAEKASSKDSLNKALVWAQKSVIKGENYQNTLVLSKIYYKLGNNEQGKDYENISKNLYQQQGGR